MKIEYKKPLFLKKKIVDTNILMDKNFTINIDFKVEEGYKKDDKIGFFGIPGRNFGISYDYKVKSFVFEYCSCTSFISLSNAVLFLINVSII
jgi:hypothetical protein